MAVPGVVTDGLDGELLGPDFHRVPGCQAEVIGDGPGDDDLSPRRGAEGGRRDVGPEDGHRGSGAVLAGASLGDAQGSDLGHPVS